MQYCCVDTYADFVATDRFHLGGAQSRKEVYKGCRTALLVTRCSFSFSTWKTEKENMCLNSSFPCQCLTDDCPCQPCRMTCNDKETEQAHLSNSTSAPGQAENTCESDQEAGVVVRERPRNWGWMLSGILCINILILGCALVSSSAYNEVDIDMSDLQIFLIILLILTSIWMIYYVTYTARQEDAVVYKDGHAGPVWLRGKESYHLIYNDSLGQCLTPYVPLGGLVAFGLLSIIMDIFKITSYAGYVHCDSAVKVVFPVVQLLFVVVQVILDIPLLMVFLTPNAVSSPCNCFADILFVDPLQRLCTGAEEPVKVGGQSR